MRIVAPMLAIETVAAGGGSICRFDGVKLVVGPDSAGADPGPACYGRGGPLTVTDCNLFLGRILPEHFPFPLDRAAVERAAGSDCRERDRRSRPADATPRRTKLAAGFVAHRQRQHGPGDPLASRSPRATTRATTCSSPSAAPAASTPAPSPASWACAQVLQPSRRRPAQRLRHRPGRRASGIASSRRLSAAYSSSARQPRTAHFASWTRRLAADVVAEGIAADAIAVRRVARPALPRRRCALTIVPSPDDGDYAAALRDRSIEQLYGYVHAAAPAGDRRRPRRSRRPRRRDVLPEPHAVDRGRLPEPHGSHRSISTAQLATDGRLSTASSCRPATKFAGPAIICEPTSTIVDRSRLGRRTILPRRRAAA